MKNFVLAFITSLTVTLSAVTASAENWSAYKIMLDPGHGGTDPGATGPAYPSESVLALRCAQALSERLNALGAPHLLTRSTDTFISLDARRSASVAYDPYIFCSIHLNAFNGTANGTETWYYWEQGNSKALAERVQATLLAEMQRANRGVKQNGWRVITGSASVPAILTEGLFVDNATEWGMIKDENSEGFNKWVNGHLFGFYDHLSRFSATLNNPRSNSQPAPTPDISVNRKGWLFQCRKGNTVSTTFAVTGTNLSTGITATSSNNTLFELSEVNLTKDGGTFKVTFKPTESGDFNAVATLTSGGSKATVNLIGSASAPSISATKNDVDVSAIEKSVRVNGTASSTFHVSGVNLEGAITLAITGASKDMWTVEPATITKSQGGANVTVKYKPTKATPDGVFHNARLTISTPNVDNTINIALKGTAIEASAVVTDASGNEITTHTYPAETKVNEQKSKTLKITGSNLEGDLKLAITGPSAQYYSIENNVASIAKADAEKGKSIKLLYKPTKATSGDSQHNATLRITSTRMDTLRIKLRGTALGPSVTVTGSDGNAYTQADFGSKRVEDTGSKTLKIKGTSLQGDLTITITGASAQYYSIENDVNSIAKADAENGKSIKIKYRPLKATGDGVFHNATLRITSKLLEDVDIPLKGAAYQASVDVTDMSGEDVTKGIEMAEKKVGQTGSRTINVNGRNLAGDMAVAIEGDDAAHFATDVTTINQDPGAARFAIKYRPLSAADGGTRHTAILRISSNRMTDVAIPLSGTATNGGTTGIETINEDVDDSSTYFNLQGHRIDNRDITPGVYIKISEGKASKVVVK